MQPLDHSQASPAGVVGGRYRVDGDLASGGLGKVQIVADIATGRRLALKRLLPTFADNAAITRLLEREYQTLRGLSHPSVIEVYDYGLDADGPYYTMELLDGSDLHVLAPLPVRTACEHLRDVAASLALLHARRLLHRDVTPRNVRVTASGRAKLIDFGALCSFGRPPDVLGTAPYVPPEALTLAGLDQRSDLFALGALAYFVLTGRHAFPVRQLSDLPSIWSQPLRPPSSFAANVPAELDALVLSLLSLDPLARPSTAGEVILRLNQIAALPAQPALDEVQSYLLNPRLVGREPQLEALRAHARKARGGDGRSVAIEGDEGVGKSRLLTEFLLEAQLLGFCAVCTEARADQSPFGAARRLGAALLQAAPALAQRAFAPHAGVLAHFLPELAASSGAAAERLPEDPVERRARIQTAFIEGLLAFSRELPVALGIDDLHAADPGSAVIVAALSRRLANARLLLITTARPQPEDAPQLRAYAASAARVRLGPLHSAETEALVRSLFGDVPEIARFAFRLHALSRGNPLLCMELAQHAVKRELVTFREGTWLIGSQFEDELPASLGESWAAVLGGLQPDARTLLELLCVHPHAMSIDRCVALAAGLGPGAVYTALDALVAAGILTLAGSDYRFAHESLREHVRSGLSAARARELHRGAAAALLSHADFGSEVWATFAACEHLMAAGEDVEAADRMAAIAYRVAFGSDILISAADSIERAIEVCMREKRSRFHYLWMLVAQCTSGWYIDPGYRIRMQERVLRTLGDVTGLRAARNLRRWLGARLGVIAAVGWAALSTWRERRGTQFAEFRQVFVALSRACAPLMAASAAAMDVQAVDRVVELVEPMRALGAKHTGTFVYEYCEKMRLLIRGREAECLELCEKNAAMLADPALLKEFPPHVREGNYVGVNHTRGIARALACDPSALDCARVLWSSEFALYGAMSGQITVLYHAARGEYEQVRAEFERLETAAIQGGSIWANEVLLPIMLMTSYELADDVVGLQQACESLRRWARVVPTIALYAEAADILFQYARGAAAELLPRSEAWVEQAQPRQRIGWAYGRALMMKILLARGEAARARRLGEQTVALIDPRSREFTALYFEVERQLALAEFAAGEPNAARGRLNDLLAFHRERDNPLHLGLLHEALASIALAVCEPEAFASHLEQVRHHFGRTGSPRLLQRSERLAAEGRVLAPAPAAPGPDVASEVATVVQATTPLRSK